MKHQSSTGQLFNLFVGKQIVCVRVNSVRAGGAFSWFCVSRNNCSMWAACVLTALSTEQTHKDLRCNAAPFKMTFGVTWRGCRRVIEPRLFLHSFRSGASSLTPLSPTLLLQQPQPPSRPPSPNQSLRITKHAHIDISLVRTWIHIWFILGSHFGLFLQH